MDLLRAVLIGASSGFLSPSDETMDCAMEGSNANNKSGFTDVISDLGKKMLSVDIICQSVFICLLK